MAFLRPGPCSRAKRSGKGRAGLWRVASVLLLLAAGLRASAQRAPSPEYQIKAVFLFHFSQFVEWPTNTFSRADAPLVIGILGEDPFGAYLDETVRGEKVNGRPLAVQRYVRVEEVKTCHILFVSQSELGRLERVFEGLKGRNILTVGDATGFTQRGGMIRFLTENNKVRLRINLDAAKTEKLTISSKLLRPAEIVGPGQD